MSDEDGPLSKWRTRHNYDPLIGTDDDLARLLEDAIKSGSTWRIVATSIGIVLAVLLPFAVVAIILYLESRK